MSSATINHFDDHEHHDDGSKTTVGFWIYLMSDCLIFAVLFATFGVLSQSTAGGPNGAQLFQLSFVLGETALLLLSSYTFGIAALEAHAHRQQAAIRWVIATFILGAAFIVMEVYEFAELLHEGAGRTRAPSCRRTSRWSVPMACTCFAACCGWPS